jgi:SAM-dependent methyltransferase
MHLSHLFQSVWKNYSLTRAYENDLVRGLTLTGRGIDLGAKSKNAKYYEYVDMSKVTDIDFVDLFSDGEGVIRMDLEHPFPIRDQTYDFVLAFNVMEHIYNYRNLVSESKRILRAGGTLHGLAPLMYRFHADPNDYFRFTWQALQRILADEGFGDIRVEPIAYGPFHVASEALGNVLRVRVARLLAYSLGVMLDRIFDNFYSGGKNYAMAYYYRGVRS